MSGSNRFSDLLVINLHLGHNRTILTKWPGRENLFPAEVCARHLLVGTVDDLHNIPAAIRSEAEVLAKQHTRMGNKATQVLHGQKAYEFLLRVACGLGSHTLTEYHILGQMREAWNDFRTAHTIRENGRLKLDDNTAKIAEYVEGAIADARCIRENITSAEYRDTSYSLAAKKLAGVGNGGTALIIADKKEMAADIARAIGKYTSNCVKKIIITHPDSSELKLRMQELATLQDNKFIQAELEGMPFKEALGKGFAIANHVFICTSMKQSPALNEQLIEASRKKTSGNITHVRIDATTKQWQEANLKNIIFPEQVKQQHQADNKRNRGAVERISRACSYAAEARTRGVEAGKVQKLITQHLGASKDELSAILDKFVHIQNISRSKSPHYPGPRL